MNPDGMVAWLYWIGYSSTTGQAAHWFDHAKTWEQLARRVRPGGTVAYLVRFAVVHVNTTAQSLRPSPHSNWRHERYWPASTGHTLIHRDTPK